jgi:hypothetical protein
MYCKSITNVTQWELTLWVYWTRTHVPNPGQVNFILFHVATNVVVLYYRELLYRIPYCSKIKPYINVWPYCKWCYCRSHLTSSLVRHVGADCRKLKKYEFRADSNGITSIPNLILICPADLEMNGADGRTDRQTWSALCFHFMNIVQRTHTMVSSNLICSQFIREFRPNFYFLLLIPHNYYYYYYYYYSSSWTL